VKIALVILHADVARGGAERYTLDLAGSLVERGHEVSILASSFQSDPTAGRRVLLAADGATRTGRYLRFLDSLDVELDRVGYDIVHAMLPVRRCHVYHPHAGIAAEAMTAGHLAKSGAAQQALAWAGNRFNVRRRRFAAVERGLLESPRPPVVLCLSRLIQAVVSRHYPDLPREKLVALFNGIDLKKFDPSIHREARKQVRARFGIDESAVVGLMLAQDFERKGLGQAIEALARIENPKMILLVGGKPDPAKYRSLAGRLGVENRVVFAGPVSDPVSFYQSSDFFVLPTRFDPCSLVVLEALAMGLPVISTVKNGACEVMEDGVHGRVLADPDDIPALTAAMLEVADSARRTGMADACLALRPRVSQESHLSQLEQVYRSIL
jgi:UDP-glucose:(heptosyl)LPS alpha-1,3-glucosyltransferase